MNTLKLHKINLISGIKKKEDNSKKRKGYGKFVWPLVILALLVGGASGFYGYKIIDAKNHINQSLAFTEAAETTQLYGKVLLIQEQRDMLADRYNNLLLSLKNLDSYPAATIDLYNVFTAAGGNIKITALTYSAQKAQLTISAAAPGALSASAYAKAIRLSDRFADVAYYGYGSDTQGNYIFEVTCLMGGEQGE